MPVIYPSSSLLSEVSSVPAAKEYVHYGEGITLTCDWKVDTPDDTYSAAAWTAGGSAVSTGTATVSTKDAGDKIEMVYKKANSAIDKKAGDTYKCAVTMSTKDDLDSTTNVMIHCTYISHSY